MGPQVDNDGRSESTVGVVDQGTTLGQLCADLGPELIEVGTAPRGLDVSITRVLLQNPLDRLVGREAAGGLLIAVGASPADEALSSFLHAAASAGVNVVACRKEAQWSAQLLETAERVGVALVTIPAQIEWGEFYELAHAAIAIDFDTGDRPVTTERPPLNDLSAIAEALAAITGGSITIDDLQWRILAFSGGAAVDEMRTTAILNRRMPEPWQREMRDHKVIEQLLETDDVICVDLDESLPRRAIAIRFGGSVVGSIWLAGQPDQLSPDANDALRQAAPIVALQLARQRIAIDVERRIRDLALANLLSGGEAPLLALRQLGLDSACPLLVIAIEVKSRNRSSPPLVEQRLVDLVTMHFHAYEHPTVAAAMEVAGDMSEVEHERVYVLCSLTNERDLESVVRRMDECIRQAERTLKIKLRCGIGYEVDEPENLALARGSADDCLALGPASQSLIRFREVRDRVLLSEVERFVLAWRGGPFDGLSSLIQHDEEHHTEYVRTLKSVCDAFGNASQVAKHLHIHVNTVRYRIKRISEITGVDLSDGDPRLALELALRAHLAADPANLGPLAPLSTAQQPQLDSSLI